jgi:hypothetical protein
MSYYPQISTHSVYRVVYRSFVDWKQYEDLIRANKNWWQGGKPRYDNVILRDDDGTAFFATCLRLYSGVLKGEKIEIGVFQKYVFQGRHHLTGMLYMKKETRLRFHFLHKIVRGGYIQPDPVKKDFFHVNDLVESDLYLRFRKM